MFNLFLFFFFFSPKEFVPEIWEFGWFAYCCLIWLLGEGSFVYKDYLYFKELIGNRQTCFL